MLNKFSSFIINAKEGSGALPCYIAKGNCDNIVNVVTNSKDFILETILRYGGVLLRGFSIRSLSEFNKLSCILSPNLLDYVNRSTPRTKLGGKIYTSTEYPAAKYIPLHNENSYTNKWPDVIMFSCVIAPGFGGETPVADSRHVLKNIDKKVVQDFEEKGVLYERNYTSIFDLGWKEVFQTEVKDEVEKYCLDNSIEYLWGKSEIVELTTRQVCQATAAHPKTKDRVWFNQAHLFNVYSLEKDDLQNLVKMVGRECLPRNSYFGDGTEIPEEYFDNIEQAYNKEKIEFKWERGDVMILDNLLMAHSRNSFTGTRKIVVSMGKLY